MIWGGPSDQVCSRGALARVPPARRKTVLETGTRAKAARLHTWPDGLTRSCGKRVKRAVAVAAYVFTSLGVAPCCKATLTAQPHTLRLSAARALTSTLSTEPRS